MNFFPHIARLIAPGVPSSALRSQWVSLRTFCVSRIVIAVALLIAFALSNPQLGLLGLASVSGWDHLSLTSRLSIIYVVLSFVALVVVQRLPQRFVIQLCGQVGLDLIFITILFSAAGGLQSGLAMLFLAPVAAGALLAPRPLALFFAALATLAILCDSAWRVSSGARDEALLLTAGMVGALSFAIALLMQQLGARLLKQETLARQRGQALDQQLSISERVIAEVPSGVLIVDHRERLIQSNLAARLMLGFDHTSLPDKLSDAPRLAPLLDAYRIWYDTPPGDTLALEVAIHLEPVASDFTDDGPPSSLPLHVRFFSPDTTKTQAVVLLENTAELDARAQQLKLAALGRLTAGIAHEVRNPLASIHHAASLLGEDSADASVQRLVRIIRQNVRRLDQLVEDVLALGRREPIIKEVVALDAAVRAVVEDLIAEQPTSGSRIDLQLDPNIRVRFNPGHLRQVLLNLLNNGLRYASEAPGALRISTHLHPEAQRVVLRFEDDGPGVAPGLRQQLFEPFFTTESSGTGLGLYLTREFCIANDARIEYSPIHDSTRRRGAAAACRFEISLALVQVGTLTSYS